ncbi:hypothetical protein ACTVZO_00495 [Streptomyces sp. IBSNAI002]|uniref:hypothetical protein n=1 Tax=Streptomyces sp. IBSNAI002 TaxID=3457500 RepID=UPI003FD542D3
MDSKRLQENDSAKRKTMRTTHHIIAGIATAAAISGIGMTPAMAATTGPVLSAAVKPAPLATKGWDFTNNSDVPVKYVGWIATRDTSYDGDIEYPGPPRGEIKPGMTMHFEQVYKFAEDIKVVLEFDTQDGNAQDGRIHFTLDDSSSNEISATVSNTAGLPIEGHVGAPGSIQINDAGSVPEGPYTVTVHNNLVSSQADMAVASKSGQFDGYGPASLIHYGQSDSYSVPYHVGTAPLSTVNWTEGGFGQTNPFGFTVTDNKGWMTAKNTGGLKATITTTTGTDGVVHYDVSYTDRA